MDETLAVRHPRETVELIGQQSAQNTLAAALAGGRMPHGWLFAGPRGIGKATLAYRLARYMFASPHGHDNPGGDLEVAPDAPAAHLVGSGTHPDLHVISSQPDGEQKNDNKKPQNSRGEIKIDQIRALTRVLAQTTSAGGARVCIVDAADEMNRNAANALLKSLEEPPSDTYFILVAHRPAKVLPTLRSRCRRLDLERLPPDDVASILSETIQTDRTQDLQEIVDLANGSIGDALRLANQGGMALAREILALTQSLPGLDTGKLHQIATRLAPARADTQFRLFSELLLAWIADLVRVSTTGQASRFGEKGTALAARLVDPERLEPWAALWENLSQDHGRTLALNLDRKQFLLNAFFALEATQRASSTL